jgi:hypothetical protein
MRNLPQKKRLVILSGGGASRSEASTQSKDPCKLYRGVAEIR